MKLSQLALWLSTPCDLDLEITGVSIDSRTVKPGNLFVAFEGEKLDGHAFAADAVNKGAIAVMAEKSVPGIGVPVFVVKNCLQALTECAKQYRHQLSGKVIALTGSNGKTTVKEMLAHVIPQPRFVSLGNFNNHLGVPINLLSVKSDIDYAIFELGANHQGDIAHTAGIVQPDIALINNIGPAHLGGFGSLEGVAIAKGEIYESLQSEGIAVINDDDTFAHFWDNTIAHRHTIRYSSLHQADVWADNIHADANICYQFNLHFQKQTRYIHLKVPGRHQVQNALAATSLALAAGVSLEDVASGLAMFSGVNGRLNVSTGYHQSTLIDDTYNANLESVRVGLEFLAQRNGKKLFVLGDLAELGEHAQSQHSQVGQIAKQLGIDQLFAIGPSAFYAVEAFGAGGHHFMTREDLVEQVKKYLNPEANVLVKGSRSAKMEEIIRKLSN